MDRKNPVDWSPSELKLSPLVPRGTCLASARSFLPSSSAIWVALHVYRPCNLTQEEERLPWITGHGTCQWMKLKGFQFCVLLGEGGHITMDVRMQLKHEGDQTEMIPSFL
ncbi:hypothetical protein BHE74_00042074 [Ensete ventricosum]|nr:hypothetical protein BHE74_00042074 [Ensete ventricosum]